VTDGLPGSDAAGDPARGLVRPGFAEAVRFWFLLGWISFGGPAGQIAIMHTELVDKRRWIGEPAFLRALNFCMLLPGPEATQLAIWIGWRLHGLRGGIIAGVLFVLPAALLLALLSWLYLRFGEVPLVAGITFGLQAAVLGIIVHAVQRIGARVLRTPFALMLAVAALLAIAVAHWPFPAIVLGAAVLGLAAWRYRPQWLPDDPHTPAFATAGSGPHGAPIRGALAIASGGLLLWWLPVLGLRAWLGADSTALAMGVFFSKAALVTVGGAYAVLPYVAEQAVVTHGWLSSAQMLTGLGLAETTPGPLILVLEFVGFVGGWQHPDLASPLASALLGAAITLWTTFLPSFLFVLTAAPWIERIGEWRWASAMLAGITAAVVGVIANLALWFGWRLLAPQTWPTIALAISIATLAYLALARWRWPVWIVVPVAGVAGALGLQLLPG
jgi:chromate transporter